MQGSDTADSSSAETRALGGRDAMPELRDAQVLAARLLDRLSSLTAPARSDMTPPSDGPAALRAEADCVAALASAKAVVAGRAERGRLFGDDLFSDPVWDLMLDAFIAAESGRRVSVSSICIAARVPTTTALRWCKQLEEHGILLRVPDETDRRRNFLVLSESARDRMRTLLMSAAAVPI